LLRIIADGADNRIAPATRAILEVMARQYSAIGVEIRSNRQEHPRLAPLV
jgi:hypothetical protein